LFFIEERCRGLFQRQRYHYLVHLIPKDYYNSTLADTVWFELTPDERPEMIEEDPDEDRITSLTSDVMVTLQEKRFFTVLDEMFCPEGHATQAQTCSGDFRYAKQVLQTLWVSRVGLV
jgi:hypothetical protein